MRAVLLLVFLGATFAVPPGAADINTRCEGSIVSTGGDVTIDCYFECEAGSELLLTVVVNEAGPNHNVTASTVSCGGVQGTCRDRGFESLKNGCHEEFGNTTSGGAGTCHAVVKSGGLPVRGGFACSAQPESGCVDRYIFEPIRKFFQWCWGMAADGGVSQAAKQLPVP